LQAFTGIIPNHFRKKIDIKKTLMTVWMMMMRRRRRKER
jgi:hypothetical protein